MLHSKNNLDPPLKWVMRRLNIHAFMLFFNIIRHEDIFFIRAIIHFIGNAAVKNKC